MNDLPKLPLRPYGWRTNSHEPTDHSRKQVETLAGLGVTQEDICTVMGIRKPALHHHYRKELDTGAIKANSTVAQSLYNMATTGENVAAAIWWTKARMGWKDTSSVDHTGKVTIEINDHWAKT